MTDVFVANVNNKTILLRSSKLNLEARDNLLNALILV